MENNIIDGIEYLLNEIEDMENELDLRKEKLETILRPFFELYSPVPFEMCDIIGTHKNSNDLAIYFSWWKNPDLYNSGAIYIPFQVLLSDNPKEEKERLYEIEQKKCQNQ